MCVTVQNWSGIVIYEIILNRIDVIVSGVLLSSQKRVKLYTADSSFPLDLLAPGLFL